MGRASLTSIELKAEVKIYKILNIHLFLSPAGMRYLLLTTHKTAPPFSRAASSKWPDIKKETLLPRLRSCFLLCNHHPRLHPWLFIFKRTHQQLLR